MEELRHADAKVYAATHPGVRARGHINRYYSLTTQFNFQLNSFVMTKTPQLLVVRSEGYESTVCIFGTDLWRLINR